VVVQPKVTEDIVDSLNRVSYCASLNVKVCSCYLQTDCKCDSSSYGADHKVLPIIKVNAPYGPNQHRANASKCRENRRARKQSTPLVIWACFHHKHLCDVAPYNQKESRQWRYDVDWFNFVDIVQPNAADEDDEKRDQQNCFFRMVFVQNPAPKYRAKGGRTIMHCSNYGYLAYSTPKRDYKQRNCCVKPFGCYIYWENKPDPSFANRLQHHVMV